MTRYLTSFRPFFGAALAALLVGSPAHAQGPTLTGLLPARNAVAAPRASNVALTFDQAISAASAGNVRVFSAQRGGQLVLSYRKLQRRARRRPVFSGS